MSLDPFAIPVAQELAEVEKIILRETTSEVGLVTRVVQYIIQNGGKRIRPLLTLLAARMSGGIGPGAARLAAAMEMIHTATLLHDDVVDDAPLRRGKPSTKAKWGNQISVLVGDFFWTKASEMIVRHGDLRVLEVITHAIHVTTEAEILEITKHNDSTIDEETYLKIIRGKTAVLLSACTQIGAILGRVSEPFEEALRRYGMEVGVAFQLADDILDYDSQEEKFGKRAGGDLREGKLTLPLLVALKACDRREEQLIKDGLLADRIEPGRFQEIVTLIHRYGGFETTRNLARQFATRAKENLDAFKPSLEKETLLSLADYAIERDV